MHLGYELSDLGEAAWLDLWSWETSVGCCAHDFSGALRWAHLKEFGSRDLMRKMWIRVESIRSSLDQLIRQLPHWISRTLRFADYTGSVSLETISVQLGLKDVWVAEFSALQLRFEDGCLFVASRWEDDEDLP